MFQCLCGKDFDNNISCSRHKSTCAIYKKSLPLLSVDYLEEGKDHVICQICGHKARDLTKHLNSMGPPHPSSKEYREKYPDARILCTDIDLKRKETCGRVYNNINYRNSSVQSVRIREALISSDVKKRIRETKQLRYKDPTYTNPEKRRKTLIEKYGTDNPMKDPGIAMRSAATRRVLYEDNPIIRPPVYTRSCLENLYGTGKTLGEIAKILNTSEAVISYWMRKHGIKITKKLVVPKNKEYVNPGIMIKEYLEYCVEKGQFLSFNLYGIIVGNKKSQRLKRLFQTGGKYHYLYGQLKDIAGQRNEIDGFIQRINSSDV